MSVENRILNFQHYIGRRLRQIEQQLVIEEVTAEK